jgi:hypothetical protein
LTLELLNDALLESNLIVQLYYPDGPRHKVIKGNARGQEMEGGIVEYTLTCEDNTNVTSRAFAYFEPETKSKRLISPRALKTTDGNISNPTNDDIDPDSDLHFLSSQRLQTRLNVYLRKYHPLTRLPTGCLTELRSTPNPLTLVLDLPASGNLIWW